MSWQASLYVKRLKVGPNGESITRSEKCLLMVLADYHNDEARAAWPSVGRLADEALLSPRRIRQLTSSLARKGVLIIEACHNSRGGSSANRYRFAELDVGAVDDDDGSKISGPVAIPDKGGLKTVSPPGGNSLQPHKETQEELPFEHTQTQAAGVRALSLHSFETILEYARDPQACPTVENPNALASARYRDGMADFLIDEWKERKAKAQTEIAPAKEGPPAADPDCPKCRGSGRYYVDAGNSDRVLGPVPPADVRQTRLVMSCDCRQAARGP